MIRGSVIGTNITTNLSLDDHTATLCVTSDTNSEVLTTSTIEADRGLSSDYRKIFGKEMLFYRRRVTQLKLRVEKVRLELAQRFIDGGSKGKNLLGPRAF